MRALFLAALLVAQPSFASYIFDGDNDEISGVLAAPLALPATLCASFKYTTHPEAIRALVFLGASPTSIQNSIGIATYVTDGWFIGLTYEALGPANASIVDDSYDGAWGFICTIQASNVARAIRSATQNGSDATDVDPGSALNDLVIGIAPDQTADWADQLAEICVFDVELGATDYTNYLVNHFTCDCLDDQGGSTLMAANLIAYYPLDNNNAMQADESGNMNSDLTVTGATYSAEHPTMSGCAAPPPATAGGVMHLRRSQ